MCRCAKGIGPKSDIGTEDMAEAINKLRLQALGASADFSTLERRLIDAGMFKPRHIPTEAIAADAHSPFQGHHLDLLVHGGDLLDYNPAVDYTSTLATTVRTARTEPEQQALHDMLNHMESVVQQFPIQVHYKPHWVNLYRAGYWHRRGKPGVTDVHAGDLYATEEAARRDVEHDKMYLGTYEVRIPAYVADMNPAFRVNSEDSEPIPLSRTRGEYL